MKSMMSTTHHNYNEYNFNIPASEPGGNMPDNALNGVYDFGGSCVFVCSNRSSVTLD